MEWKSVLSDFLFSVISCEKYITNVILPMSMYAKASIYIHLLHLSSLMAVDAVNNLTFNLIN
jgi:hypothetical protein